MFIMFKYLIFTNIIHCQLLADFIDFENNKIMKFCSTCRRHSRVYKIYFRFQSYNECLRRNQKCNVCITENKWKKLKTEKFKFRQKIRDAFTTQEKIRKIENKIAFNRRVTLIKKMRLHQQMNILKKELMKSYF